MEKTITFSKTYRYEVIPCKNDSKKVLYVLHGYGQLSKFFIRKFDELSDHFHVIAPEGMHRFYLEGSSERVGASWMTKEARENDIADNINWLNELDRLISKELQIEERHILGFSQGGATAARWYSNSKLSFDSITLWACVFPPDLEPTIEIGPFRDFKNGYFVIGKNDQYYDVDAQLELIEFYKDLDFKTLHFDGDHNIHIDVLKSIYDSNV